MAGITPASVVKPLALSDLSDAGKLALVAVFGGVALLVLFWPTAWSAVELWRTSSAYNYGYLIAPISIYLIWTERHRLSSFVTRPCLWGVAVAGAFMAIWLAADMLGLNEGRHFALIGMMQGLFLAVLGAAMYRALAFPLNYLWLMVPTGTFLLPALQNIAHAGSVFLLRASGIPVFADGLLIEVPQGSFLVEPGCAGLNFFLSALALSLVYGKVMYSRLSTRFFCVVVALAAAVVANVVRIYLIIALTQWTHRQIGLADDHLLFGWGFFALIILALMGLGMRIANPPAAPAPRADVLRSRVPVSHAALSALAVVCVAAVGPMLSPVLKQSPHLSSARQDLSQRFEAWRGHAE